VQTLGARCLRDVLARTAMSSCTAWMYSSIARSKDPLLANSPAARASPCAFAIAASTVLILPGTLIYQG